MMNKEELGLEVTNVDTLVEDFEVPAESTRRFPTKMAIGLGIAAGLGLLVTTVVVLKKKINLDKIRAERLKKKGYTVIEPMEDIVCENTEIED